MFRNGFHHYALVLLMFASCAGCNSVEVHDSASVYMAVSEARGEAESKRVLTQALAIGLVDGPNHPPTGGEFSINQRIFNEVASRLSSFNGGDYDAGRSFEFVYDRLLLTDRHPTVSLTAVLTLLQRAANHVIDSGMEEDRRYARVLLAAGYEPGSGRFEEPFLPDVKRSPVQTLMFGFWLYQHAEGLDPVVRALDIDDGAISKLLDGVPVPICVSGEDGEPIECTINPANGMCNGVDFGNFQDALDACLTNPDCRFGTCAGDPPRTCYGDYAGCVVNGNQNDLAECDLEVNGCIEEHGGGSP